MEVTELFSKGFEIFKKNWIIAVPQVAVGIIIAILAVLLMGSMLAGAGMMGVGGFQPGMGTMGAFMGTAILFGLSALVLSMLGYGMTYIMARDAIGGQVDLSAALQKTLERIVNLVIVSVLVGVIVAIGSVLLIIPGLVAAFILMFSILLVAIGDSGAVESLGQSYELVKNNLEQTVIFAVLALVIMVVAGIIGKILGPLSFFVTAVVTAYILTVQVLLYQELKK